jgi:tRNA (Thr-GGU) A37 N-methylase
MDAITYTPIGVVRSPFTTLEGMPLQSVAAQGIPGSIELEPAFREGLKDLEAFSPPPPVDASSSHDWLCPRSNTLPR